MSFHSMWYLSGPGNNEGNMADSESARVLVKAVGSGSCLIRALWDLEMLRKPTGIMHCPRASNGRGGAQ